MIATAIGMLLAALFVMLLSTASVSEAEVKRVDPSHYAVPAEPPVDRASSFAVVRVVSGGGY